MRKRAAIDTNVIVRFITNDIPELYEKACALLLNGERDYVVDEAVIMETIYVLEGASYGYSRLMIVAALERVMKMPNFIISEREVTSDALEMYLTHPKLSYTDCYLGVKAAIGGYAPLYTFDKKLAGQMGMVELVG